MSSLQNSSFLVGYWMFLLPFSTIAADPAGIAFFEQKIRPILAEHCYSCHSAEAEKLKGNLYLDSKAGWQNGGDSGMPAILPGDPDASLLIRTIRHLEEDMAMPPKKPKLPDAVIADLVTWVKRGAPDPRDGVKVEAKRGDKSWWSLQPLAKQFAHDRIDGFITAKLAEKPLALNPPADPRALIRRMTYDVTGLPPSPEEVDAFVAESVRDPQSAIRNLVDRLLASPRYGERWGRHWLDVIRFGESNGFERNFVIDDLWPFRDYVIQSINDDKPFDQFIREHLAGDVIGKDNPAIEVGSAFLVAGPYDDVGNQDVVAQKNIRAATLDEIVTATSGAFLGLTVNCARCHNHKFDPIPAEDYYRLRAAFEGIHHGRRVVASKAQRQAHAAALKPLQQQLNRLTAEMTAFDAAINKRSGEAAAAIKATRPKVDPHGTDESFPATQAKFLRFVIHGFTNAPAARKRPAATGGKLTEFQVWSTGGANVALASHGTRAEGAKSAVAEDFPEAYGPQYCIDGMTGEGWFIGNPPVLTLTFAKPETINRITFINARGERGTDEGKVAGATPCEYEIQTSLDGATWTTVATDEGREPWSQDHRLARARRSVITPEESQQLAAFEQQIAGVQRQINQIPKLPQIWVGNPAQPAEPTFLHKGGDPMKPGEPVVPASLSVLDQVTQPYQLQAGAPEAERRLALANWITRDNPLTARVLANRVWQYHFGTGIVDTPSDLGFLGSKPTHPELLDYLAGRLIANGWKLKALHREILLSKTYQQSAAYRQEAAQQDKDARLLWRFPPRRLSAEEIRDTLLSVAGKLQLEPMGGPGFRLYKFTQNNVCTYFPLDVHGPDTYRRAVYHQNARASVVDVLNDFDLPDIAFAAPKRANTTTPLQALTLLNHSFTLDMAQALAARIQNGDAITNAYRLTFQREPSAKEYAAATQLIASHGLTSFCRALLNANELLYLE
jgi:mono/diheme cytochrome c family protein